MAKRTVLLPEHHHCGLCLRTEPLCQSHILADHIGDWMKAHSATGKFRQGAQPNRTVQDLPKIRLLCEGCEQGIKILEDAFKTTAFDPWGTEVEAARGELPDDVPLADGTWQDLHTLSLVWRALHVHNDEKRRRFLLSPLAEAADKVWRPALLTADLPPNSHFWVIQSKKMDELLKRRGHVGNRRYILTGTHIGSSDTMVGVRRMFEIVRTAHVGGQELRFTQQRGYALGVAETGRGYFLSFVKGYGFCFFGLHVEDGAIASSLNLDELAAETLAFSIRENKKGIDDRLSPKQKAADAAARKKHEENPTLAMLIREADERELAALRAAATK